MTDAGRRWFGRMAALLLIGSVIGCLNGSKGADPAPRLYQTRPLPPGWTEDAVRDRRHLGPTLLDKGVNFGVYSEHATRIDVLLFDDPEAERPTRQIPLNRLGDVWNVYVEGIGEGQHYGFVAWGPNWQYDPAWSPGSVAGFVADVDAEGNRFNPNKLLIDPYARALHRDHDWSKGSVGTGPSRTQSTWAAAAKGVVVVSRYDWSDQEDQWRAARMSGDHPGHAESDLVLYEMHVKGFTQDASSGVAHPGSYRGVGEKASYLRDLGVNAVELLPVHEKPLDGGYWGYMTLHFFAPELSYSSRPEPRAVLDEFKWMVDQLHQQGVEVIVDVVYNHHGEGGLWRERRETTGGSLDSGTTAQMVNLDPEETAGIYSFRGLDNAAYYALPPENKRSYWNNTGVGQQTRPNHAPFRQLILDSLRFYVEELHVDGFRFDLAPVLGEKDGAFNRWDDVQNTVLQQIIDDPVLRRYHTRVIAEPWAAGGDDPYKVGKFPAASDGSGAAWGEWNGRFRDWWRAFINDDGWRMSSLEGNIDGGAAMTGSAPLFQFTGRRPQHSVNFVTVHDGFTLYDLFSYAQKQNGCGPLNPSCCDAERLSAWCDSQSGESHNRSRDWGSSIQGEALKRQMMRNAFVGLLISHGTPLILGGDEWMRTQLGNNNAYSTRADNPANWFQWGSWEARPERRRMHDFVRQLLRLRREHRGALAPADWGSASFAWKNAANQDKTRWDDRHVMIHHFDTTKGPELAILINMERRDVDFRLPEGRRWVRLVDTQTYFDRDETLNGLGQPLDRTANATLDSPEAVTGANYVVKDSSIVVLEARP